MGDNAMPKFMRATKDTNTILLLSVKLISLLAVAIVASVLSAIFLLIFKIGGTPQIFDMVTNTYCLWLSFTFADKWPTPN